jgi:hypothetical protein
MPQKSEDWQAVPEPDDEGEIANVEFTRKDGRHGNNWSMKHGILRKPRPEHALEKERNTTPKKRRTTIGKTHC